MNKILTKAIATTALFGLLAGIYLTILRPTLIRWGAVHEELIRSMPGDNLVFQPTFNATRAVTVEATPEEIWPWIIQMGYGRAGFYGYDLLEGLGSPSGLRSEVRIIPELQQINIGSDLQIFPGAHSIIADLRENQYLVWGCDPAPCTCAFTWALYPVDQATTRLVSRAQCDHLTADPRLFLFTELFDHVAIRKILLGIKGRAEGHIEPVFKQDLEFALWIFAILIFFSALILLWVLRSWRNAWFVALASGLVLLSLYVIGYWVWLVVILELGLLIGLFWAGKVSVGGLQTGGLQTSALNLVHLLKTKRG